MILSNLFNSGRYYYEGTKYYIHKYIFNNYEIRFEIFRQNGKWVAVVESDRKEYEDIVFPGKYKIVAFNLITNWFKNIVNNEKVDKFIKNGYDIYPNYSEIFYSVRDKLIGYHFADKSNKESILQKGLIANGYLDPSVYLASRLIDQDKPWYVPKDIIRTESNYAWPILTNYLFSQYASKSLFAIKIKYPKKCWVGSQGIGGFCLCPDDEEEKYKFMEECKEKYTKEYWRYSCSLKSYINNGLLTRWKNHYYGLDEILLSYTVEPNDIIHLGDFDSNGQFHQTQEFENYIKPKYKNEYKKILEKYKLK